MSRKAFIETISELAEKDDKVILVVGDVGFSFMEPFIEKFPRQFLNAGVAEQSMMGIATGLSFAGYKPYVYSMINFVCFRPYEQVRNDIAFQNANVKIFGVKGSAAYKFLGFSHNIIEGDGHAGSIGDEDQLLMENLPNMNTYFPADEFITKMLMMEEYERSGPAYFRI